VFAGRVLEMMVGVARVSDLTIFWVLLGLLEALPQAMRAPNPAPQPIRPSSRRQRLNPARAPSFPQADGRNWHWLLKLAVVSWLVGAIFILTWTKGISYPLAAMQVGHAMEYSRQGDLPSTLAAIDRAIELAPDVSVYYNWRASVFTAYRRDPRGNREQRCDTQNYVSYQVCLAALAYESNLAGSNQRPFYYRSKIAVAGSAFNLRLDDEAIRYYRETLALVPGSWTLRNNLASALIQQGKPAEALEPLEGSLEITKGSNISVPGLILRARAYSELGRHAAAIDDLDRVVEFSSGNAQAYARRAIAYANLGENVHALEDATRAVELGVDREAMDRAIKEIKAKR
jgi:Tfp pilus assembly protein PilF